MTTSVLLVDDDLGVLQALMRRMHKEPFQVRTATSAEEALGILSRSPIDLIVSDMNMPGMTGLELLAVVAKKYPDCIRIMLRAGRRLMLP
jgi:DNA-binding NtrC family response regulator